MPQVALATWLMTSGPIALPRVATQILVGGLAAPVAYPVAGTILQCMGQNEPSMIYTTNSNHFIITYSDRLRPAGNFLHSPLLFFAFVWHPMLVAYTSAATGY